MPAVQIQWKQIKSIKFHNLDYLEVRGHKSILGRIGVKQVQDGQELLTRYLRYTSDQFGRSVDMKDLT
jgi:hypothetical protein